MYQIVKQTHEEKVAMYMKLKKSQLVEMLITCNEILRLKSEVNRYCSDEAKGTVTVIDFTTNTELE